MLKGSGRLMIKDPGALLHTLAPQKYPRSVACRAHCLAFLFASTLVCFASKHDRSMIGMSSKLTEIVF